MASMYTFSHPTSPIYSNQWTYTASVNKPAKDFLKRRFEVWYTKELSKQLHGNDIDTVELQPVNIRLAALKELGAKWLVQMAEYT